MNAEQRGVLAGTQLTHRELQIVKLVAEGHGNLEIGARLYLSELTVKTYLSRIYAKTGTVNRTQLVAKVSENDRGTTRAIIHVLREKRKALEWMTREEKLKLLDEVLAEIATIVRVV